MKKLKNLEDVVRETEKVQDKILKAIDNIETPDLVLLLAMQNLIISFLIVIREQNPEDEAQISLLLEQHMRAFVDENIAREMEALRKEIEEEK